MTESNFPAEEELVPRLKTISALLKVLLIDDCLEVFGVHWNLLDLLRELLLDTLHLNLAALDGLDVTGTVDDVLLCKFDDCIDWA